MAEAVILVAIGYFIGAGARFRVILFTFVLGTLFGIVSVDKIKHDVHAVAVNVTDYITDSDTNEVANHDANDETILETSENDLQKLAREIAREYEIDETLFLSLITQESQWNPNAESPKGARGLGQVITQNAVKCGIEPDDLWLPKCNLMCSAVVLKEALDYWKGDVKHALAEYNAGRDAVENRNALTEFGETRRYVARILAMVAGLAENTACASKSCLRMKEDAMAGGDSLAGLFALAALIQNNVDGVIYFSAFNDDYEHIENGHKEGRALDFTLTDNSRSQAVVKQVNAIGLQAGVTLRVLDEYKNPSPNATAGHIHVEFTTENDAQTFLQFAVNQGGYKNV